MGGGGTTEERGGRRVLVVGPIGMERHQGVIYERTSYVQPKSLGRWCVVQAAQTCLHLVGSDILWRHKLEMVETNFAR